MSEELTDIEELVMVLRAIVNGHLALNIADGCPVQIMAWIAEYKPWNKGDVLDKLIKAIHAPAEQRQEMTEAELMDIVHAYEADPKNPDAPNNCYLTIRALRAAGKI